MDQVSNQTSYKRRRERRKLLTLGQLAQKTQMPQLESPNQVKVVKVTITIVVTLHGIINNPPLWPWGGHGQTLSDRTGGGWGFVAGMSLPEFLGGEIGRRRAANFTDFTRRSRHWGGLGGRSSPGGLRRRAKPPPPCPGC